MNHAELCERRDFLLPLCAEGLREVRHPYVTIARLAFADLAALEDCEPIGTDVLRQVMTSLRRALVMDGKAASAAGVFDAALAALQQLVQSTGPRIAPLLQMVLPPMAKRAGKGTVQNTLVALETFGGPEAVRVMRARGLHAH